MAVPASLLASSGFLVVASAYVSRHLAFIVTIVLSRVFLERVLSPELVDGFFRKVDAVVLKDLRLVRDAIRAEPRTAPTYAAAEERVSRAHAFVTNAIDGIEREPRANLSVLKDAAAAAFLWLRLAAGVANLTATVLMNTALEEARSRAPLVLAWRGVKGLKTNEEVAEPESKNTTLLVVWIAAILAYRAQVVTVGAVCSSIASFCMCLPCFAALCGFTLMEAESVYLWGSYAIDTTVNPRGDAAVGGVKDKKDLRVTSGWEFLWFLIITMNAIDIGLLACMLGGQTFVLAASLAIYNVAALNAARQAYLTADDADGWRRAALRVLTMDIAKVVATYLAIDFYLGALFFVCLCVKAAFFLERAIYMSDDCASGDDNSNQEGVGIAENVAGDAEGSDNNNQESAGLAEDVAGDAQGSDDDNQESAGLVGNVTVDAQGADDVGAENSSDIFAYDHDEEEGSTTEEHSDVSDSEELRRQESGCSSSSSMNDWSFVGVDPMMPTDVNGGVDRKFRFFL